MSDSAPGFSAVKETEEVALFASGEDNQHQRVMIRGTIKSSVTDSGNTPTTTVRGGRVLGLRDADSLLYSYDADATNGDQKVVGLLPKHLSMLDRDGTAENKPTKIAIGGIIKDVTQLLGYDLHALSVLFRRGFRTNVLEPHGSMFGLAFKTRYFKDGTALSGAYTVVAADHGCTLCAVTAAMNFTMPSLAAVGKGFFVHLYNNIDATMIVTSAADTILAGDAGGGASTTITFSTANRKMGASVLMYADYASDGGSLAWYPLFVSGNPTYA